MARAELGYRKWCSYKRTTLIICSINIVIALYVLHSLYNSLYLYSNNPSLNVAKYSPGQIRKMEEAIRHRSRSKPTELVNLVEELKKDFSMEEAKFELPRYLKLKITDGILQRLKGLNITANVSTEREVVESWRQEKLEEAKQSTKGENSQDTTIPPEEARILVRALESKWEMVLEDIGLWIPPEIVNNVHDDKPEGEEPEDEIIPGRRIPAECHAELHTDYGGLAVRWGLTHHKESAADCCQACLDQSQRAKPGENKCNIWVYCPLESGCHSPDIYQHKHQECWLKFAETPKLNFKEMYSEAYRNAHPTAPLVVPWISGVTT